MSRDHTPPEIPDLSGPIPAAWNALIDTIGEVEPDSRARVRQEARLKTWVLFTDLRFRQIETQRMEALAKAANKQATSLKRATWALAAFTLVLIVATIRAAYIAR
ncbi:MAG: hypothetical protein ACRDG9_01870, partial [Actinomycetota bacterium]